MSERVFARPHSHAERRWQSPATIEAQAWPESPSASAFRTPGGTCRFAGPVSGKRKIGAGSRIRRPTKVARDGTAADPRAQPVQVGNWTGPAANRACHLVGELFDQGGTRNRAPR